MKALGTGLGAFALTDVEVRRTAGHRRHAARAVPGPARRRRRRWPRRRAPGASTCSLTHTDDVAIAFVVAEQSGRRMGPGPCGRRCGDGVCGVSRMRAVLTREEMRAADPAALAQVTPRDPGAQRAGTAVGRTPRWALLGGAYGRRVVVVAGKGSQRRRRPGGRGACSPDAGHGCRCSRPRPSRRGAAAVRPGDRRRVRHRVPRALRRAGRAAGARRVLAIDLPSGVDADSGEAPGERCRPTRTVTFAALKPGLLQGDGPAAAGGSRWPTSASDSRRRAPPCGGRRRRRRCRRARRRASTSGPTRWASPRARPGWRASADPVHPWRHGGGLGHDPPGTARRPVAAVADRGVRMHLPARGLGARVPGGDGQVQGGR